MKHIGSIFTKLEKVSRSKYPKFIKNILIETAFNTPAALKAINEASIEQIESIMNNDLNLLNKTVYVNERGELKKKPFKFLIGHKALILNFPKEISELELWQKSEKNKKKSEKKPKRNENQDEIDLKILLVEKVANHLKKKKIAINLELEITNFEKGTARDKCLVKCPFCSKKIPCTYETRWQISNLCTHIFTHPKKTSSPLLFQRARAGVLSEVTANLG